MRSSPAMTQMCRSVHVPVMLLRALIPEAKRRNTTPEILAYLLLDKIAEDNLVAAVLDDE